MREVFDGNETIKYWTKEEVYSIHAYYTLIVVESKFFYTDGTISSHYYGMVNQGDDYRITTNIYQDMKQLIEDFQKLLG